MTQLNKNGVAGMETGSVGVLAPQSHSAPVSVSLRSRHSTRISVSLPVLVQDNLGTREQALTHYVSSRGAVLALKSNVHIGQKIAVQNLKNGKSAECHVIGVENIVNQVRKVEVEFIQPQADFWPVQFPQEKQDDRSPETGSGQRQIGSSAVAPAGQPSGNSLASLQQPASQTQDSAADPLLLSNSKPDAADGDIALVLAAPIERKPLSETAFHVQSFSASAASMDSVAQFRAATRSASRRKQQIRGISFAGSVAMIVCAFFAARTTLRHHPVKLFQNSSAATSQEAPEGAVPQPEVALSEPANAPAATSTPAPEPEPASVLATNLTASSGGEQITLPQPSTSAPPAEIAVRHGITLPKPAAMADDEPIALPLKAANESKTSTEINQVLARTSHANAVLAPRPVLQPARLLSTVRPEYPATARQYRVEGEVVMTVEIDPSGNVADVKVVSGPPVLRLAATSAVRQWKYQAATYGDQPVSSSVTAKLDFHLR
jgi:TonB family protein